jgi:hypothetical protein
MDCDDLTALCAPFTAARTFAALRAADGGAVELLSGHPATF